jgi:thiosulfate/3-mercaptopyruvate sulfurtransferase
VAQINHKGDAMTALAACLLAAFGLPAADYSRPDLLIEPDELAKVLADKGVRVLDCRGKGLYLDAHVPGAVWLNATEWTRSFGEGKDRAGWARRIGALGVDADSRVVLYDDSRAKDAARAWWILRYWGVRDVRLLNGGWQGWKASGGKAETGESRPAAGEARLTPQPARLATKSQVLGSLKQPAQVVDARSAEEHCGTLETAKRNGSIPGALHLEWSDVVDKTGRFKSPQELRRIFQEAGIDPSRPTITYCQSGGRAAVMAFAIELMGGKDVRNYYRSWAEWGNAEDTPIVKPKPKK